MIPHKIRPATLADAPALAHTLVETNVETFRGRVPANCLLSLTVEESARNWRRSLRPGGMEAGKFVLVAENEEASIMGFVVAGGGSPGFGCDRELNVLMVGVPWQRQGVGRLLIARAAAELQHQGAGSLLIGVLVENPNRAFYERLGGRLLGRRPYNWAGYRTEELLFGWPDIGALSRLAP